MPERKPSLRTADLERNVAETAARAARVKASANKLQDTIQKWKKKLSSFTQKSGTRAKM